MRRRAVSAPRSGDWIVVARLFAEAMCRAFRYGYTSTRTLATMVYALNATLIVRIGPNSGRSRVFMEPRAIAA